MGVGSPERQFEASVPAVDGVRWCLLAAVNSRQADASATCLLPAQTWFRTVTASQLQRLWPKLLQCCRQPQVQAAVGRSIGGPLDHRRRLQGMWPQWLHNMLAAASSCQISCELAISPDGSKRHSCMLWTLLHLLRCGMCASRCTATSWLSSGSAACSCRVEMMPCLG